MLLQLPVLWSQGSEFEATRLEAWCLVGTSYCCLRSTEWPTPTVHVRSYSVACCQTQHQSIRNDTSHGIWCAKSGATGLWISEGCVQLVSQTTVLHIWTPNTSCFVVTLYHENVVTEKKNNKLQELCCKNSPSSECRRSLWELFTKQDIWLLSLWVEVLESTTHSH